MRKSKIEYYESISDMPIDKWEAFNNAVLLDSGVGSDILAVFTHTNKISNFINADNKIKALGELRNMELGINHIFENYNTTKKSFKYIIKSIDGKEPTAEAIEKLYKNYDISYNLVTNEATEVKKKSKTKLKILLEQIKQVLMNIITTLKKTFKIGVKH